MKRLIAPVCCIVLGCAAVAQRDTGVGRPGGARSEQSESRSASLAAANDAELKPYAALISTELKSNVRSARRELDDARKEIPSLLVTQFLVTKDVARTYKVPVQRLVSEMSGLSQKQGPGLAAMTSASEGFADILAQTLHKVKPEVSAEDAKKLASSAVVKVNAVQTE
jgi:hypothetical protein